MGKRLQQRMNQVTLFVRYSETTLQLKNRRSTYESECIVLASIYLPYDPAHWSPLQLYRTQNDVVASIIYQSRSEGIGRVEIGKKLGLDATTKGGNRRVSQSIQAAVNAFPNHIGQYQKMEGKYRMIK